MKLSKENYIPRKEWDHGIVNRICTQDFMIEEFIHRRRRQLVFHSMIYYRFNSNLVSDAQWDTWAKELQIVQNKYPHITVKYMNDPFKDWDGSTGYNLNDQSMISTIQRMLQ